MTKPNRNLDARGSGCRSRRRGLLAMLPLALIAAAFAAVAVAPAASAQDPGSDQYSPEPTQPGNDSSPDDDLSPVPAVGTDSGDTGGGDSGGSSGGPAVTPSGPRRAARAQATATAVATATTGRLTGSPPALSSSASNATAAIGPRRS